MNNLFLPFKSFRILSFVVIGLLHTFQIACSQKEDNAASRTDTTNKPEQKKTIIYYHSPAWSSDGKRIAFGSNMDGNFEVYTIRIDGSDLQRLTNTEEGGSGEPAWSPDGSLIAYTSRSAIHVMNVDGTNYVRLSDSNNATAPSWSPDGSMIAYEARFNGNNDIYVMSADGSAVTRLTEHTANDFRPTWSPDGAQIVFQSKRDGNYDLYIMNADGSNITQLTETEAHEVCPDWSPDGEKILFTLVHEDSVDVKSDIYILNLSNKKQTLLTSSSVSDNKVCWSPDGKKIAYMADIENIMALYIMNSDGANPLRLMSQSLTH